jgi:hypothetical protein
MRAAAGRCQQRKADEDVPRWKPGPVPWPRADADLWHGVRDLQAKVEPQADLLATAQARLGRKAGLRSIDQVAQELLLLLRHEPVRDDPPGRRGLLRDRAAEINHRNNGGPL